MRRGLFVFVLAAAAMCQDPRGSITGRVNDASEALMPGVEVRALNIETGVSASARTSASGVYNIPFLPPGSYTVTAVATGFKKFVRDNIEVRVSEAVGLDIRMEIGAVTDTVEVKAETPLLDTTGASLGQVIDQRRIKDLPLFTGNAIELMLLSPGVVEPKRFMWKPSWNSRALPTDGNGPQSNDFEIDGVPNTFPDGSTTRYAFAPPAAAVREFKMQTTAYDASVGHTAGALTNISTTSGTNALHGELHYWARNSAFDAPNFFNNMNRVKKTVYQDHRYGASAGGPVVLPHVYKGANKTFWFFAWEGNRYGSPLTHTLTVPTAAERRGDFSALLALGNQYQIYDPATIAAAGNGRFSRQPLAGNIIPASRLNPISQKLLTYYPLPTRPGRADGGDNFFQTETEADRYNVYFGRFDHAFTENHRMFLRLDYDNANSARGYAVSFRSPENLIITDRTNKGLALDDVIVLRPTLVLNLRYGTTFQSYPARRGSQGFNLASLGFSDSLVKNIDPSLATLPAINMGSFARVSWWEDGDGANTGLTHSVAASLTKIWGKHTLKSGLDGRLYRTFGNRYPESTAPVFNFTSTYTRGPLDSSAAAPLGQELASMMFGIPEGYMTRSASYALQDRYIGLYLQDDFKLSRRLTLNLGLRLEQEAPITERYNRLVAGFAFDQSNPIEAQARANYARNPIPELPVSAFRAPGGLTFVNQGAAGRSPFGGARNNFLPRIGLAYELNRKTVLRSGYGIYFDTMGVGNTSAVQSGFSQTTPIQASVDNGLTFIASMANPFPNGLTNPAGAAGGLTTNLNQSIRFYDPNLKRGYAQRWSLGVQRLLPGGFVADVSYVGNRGTHLRVVRQYNNVPARYLSTTGKRDQATIDFLSAQFPNPFQGINPIYPGTISRGDLLRPFPEFGNVSVAEPIGYSWYHSMQSRIERRFAQGITVQVSHAWSKLMEANSFMNPTDPAPYRSISPSDYPKRLSGSVVWEVPVGRGRRFGSSLSSPLNALIGGWRMSMVFMHQSGAPLDWYSNPIFNGNIKNIELAPDQRDVWRWFNTDAGFNRNSKEKLGSNIRTFPEFFSGLRADGRSDYDLSAIKDFRLREGMKLQFRAEGYNIANHPPLLQPETDPTSSSFGVITRTASPTSGIDSRSFQFAVKIEF